MTLEELFSTNPELQNQPEVQNLIAYVQEKHKTMHTQLKKYVHFHDQVLDKCMNSEVMIINGKKAEDTVKEIFLELEKI